MLVKLSPTSIILKVPQQRVYHFERVNVIDVITSPTKWATQLNSITATENDNFPRLQILLNSLYLRTKRRRCLLGMSEIAGSSLALAFRLQRNKMFLRRSLVKIEYCAEPLWPRGSVLGSRPPGLEFWTPCLEGSVTLFISPSWGGCLGPV